jgi:2Fe-2S ferredoxin
MPKVRIVNADGSSTAAVEVAHGESVMEAAMAAGIDGIVAECGGNAMCATCHVYVDPAWLDRLPPMLEFEDVMLDSTASPRLANSRLSCQLIIDEDCEGLTVQVPPTQI